RGRHPDRRQSSSRLSCGWCAWDRRTGGGCALTTVSQSLLIQRRPAGGRPFPYVYVAGSAAVTLREASRDCAAFRLTRRCHLPIFLRPAVPRGSPTLPGARVSRRVAAAGATRRSSRPAAACPTPPFRGLRPAARSGHALVPLQDSDVIPLPEGATVAHLPGRRAYGVDRQGKFVALE